MTKMLNSVIAVGTQKISITLMKHLMQTMAGYHAHLDLRNASLQRTLEHSIVREYYDICRDELLLYHAQDRNIDLPLWLKARGIVKEE